MPKQKNPEADKAEALFRQGMKLIDIAKELDLPPGTIRRWKSSYKWDSERSDKKKANVRNKGGQPKNKNAVGNPGGAAPPENKNAEKHGLFTKYLPAETLALIDEIKDLSPLDMLWDQIMIQYAAIIRSQQIMHVTDKGEMIKELKRSYEKSTERSTAKTDSNSNECEYEYEFQFAWDRQATFLKAQSRAMGELRNLIKQYDEMLHKNWASATEEQKLRIDKLKLDIAKAKEDDPEQTEDDGFLDALNGQADEIWQE